MNATEEDEFGDFLGLPSDVGATCLMQIPSHSQTNPTLPEPDDLYNELYGNSTAQTNVSYGTNGLQQLNTSFGNVEKQNSIQSSISVNSQRGNELAHEPLFPDVDETKIQPTLGLGGSLSQTLPQHPTNETEFSIVIDPSGLDARFNPQGNAPMAGWVIPNQHNKREGSSTRPTQSNFQAPTTTPRPPGGTNVGPLHPRGPPSGAPRTPRIPVNCNADLEPEFPSRAAPDQALKLPGQTRVTPDEYKEFLGLGHGEIFNLDLDRVVDPPWRLPGAEPSDFFNYGMDEILWKEYCKKIESHRQEFSMKKKIQTYESTTVSFQQDPDLPPEVAAAIAAETGTNRSGVSQDVPKALPIPVFQGVDDYSLRNRRGRDFRRPEVRFDTEVIVELVGGLEISNAVNVDYGEDYVGLFNTTETLQRVHGSALPPTNDDLDKVVPKKEEDLAVSEEEEETNKPIGTKEDTSTMFGEDEYNNPPYEGVQPGELAMGMDLTAESQGNQSWPIHKSPSGTPGSRGGPPRGEFGRNYEYYGHHPSMWRPPFHQGPRGWRPRGGGPHMSNPEFWNYGRGMYGRRGGGGGRNWGGHPQSYGRRGGRHAPIQRYEEYSVRPSAPWSRMEDHGKPMQVDSDYSQPPLDNVKDSRTDREDVVYDDHGDERYYDNSDWRRYDGDENRQRSYSGTRMRVRDYDQDYLRTDRYFGPAMRDHGRPTRREEYDERHRDKRRQTKMSDRRSRRSSKEKLRVRDKEDKRNRRYDTTSESGSDRGGGHYRNRS
eukprot:g3893.t1